MKKTILLIFIIPLFSFGQSEVKVEYWDNGNVLSQVHYKDGVREGSCRYYHKNGVMMSEGFYFKGKMSGDWGNYYNNGQIESHGTYKYTESGVYSQKDGVWKHYYDNGQLQRKSIIKGGAEELEFYDKQGNLTPMGDGC